MCENVTQTFTNWKSAWRFINAWHCVSVRSLIESTSTQSCVSPVERLSVHLVPLPSSLLWSPARLKLKCSSSHYILLRLFPHFLPVSKSLIEFLCFTTQEVSVVPWDLSLLPGPCSHGFSCLASSMPILWLDLLSSGAKNTKITIFPPIIYALVHSGLLSTVLQLLTCDTCLWVSVLMVCVVVTPHNILLHH